MELVSGCRLPAARCPLLAVPTDGLAGIVKLKKSPLFLERCCAGSWQRVADEESPRRFNPG
jgi:hypothetical protein